MVVSTVPYDADGLPVVVHAHGVHLRHVLGHGLALAVDGREALIGEVDRSQSALWTTNPYAVAWIRWCLKQELAGLADATWGLQSGELCAPSGGASGEGVPP